MKQIVKEQNASKEERKISAGTANRSKKKKEERI